MKYKTMSKEKIVSCPVFRHPCLGEECSAFERHLVEKPTDRKASKKGTKKRGKKGKEKVRQDTLSYCTFFKTDIK